MSADDQTPRARLPKQIAAGGPISVAHFMGEANAHYYATRDPLGMAGDFTTAPEISQMFGELIGLCLADMWMRTGEHLRAGEGRPPLYVELGPGRGTLAADALRAMASVGLTPRTHFVETSPLLRGRQQAAVPTAQFHDSVESLPDARAGGGPLLVVANEFFDALPIEQMVRTAEGWRERRVDMLGDSFAPFTSDRTMDGAVPGVIRDAPVGSLYERSPASATAAMMLASRIRQQGGAAIVIDYGFEGPAVGETLQAVRAHERADPFADPGEIDLTAHVDFTMIGNAARQMGLKVVGPVGQGDFLTGLGIEARAASLARSAPARAAEVEAARVRLTAPEQMGVLFKAMALVHPDWPTPEGFGGA